MKYLFIAIAAVIIYPFVVLRNIFYVMWHFEVNPILRTEAGSEGTGEYFKIRVWDSLFCINKKKRSNFYKNK